MEKNEIYIYIHIHNYINKSLRECVCVYICLSLYICARACAYARSPNKNKILESTRIICACVDDIVRTLPWPNTTDLQPHRAISLQPKAELCKL